MDATTPSNNASQSTDDCTICLNNLTSGAPVLTLSCNHKFHFQCLTQNIQANNHACPICRADIDSSVVQQLSQSIQSSTQVQQTVQPQATNTVTANTTIPSVEDLIDEATARAISDRFAAARQATFVSADEDNNVSLLTAATTLEYEAQPSNQESNIYGLVTLQATSAYQTDNQQLIQSRAPIDLVCVVDRSGSMAGEKIALLRKTLIDIVNQLGELDRLAIVSFNSEAVDRSHGLKRITQENKQILTTAINDITSGGSTYIGSGLQKGIDLLINRQTKNPLTALLVLTDGQDTQQHDYKPIMDTLPEGVQCYTFGYGSDHNAELLVQLAEQGNDGTFTFIDQERAVSTAFAMTMAGLLSCMAQKIVVHIELTDGYQITNFHSIYKCEPEQFPSTKLSVKIPNLNADEKRNLLFQLYVPRLNDDQNSDIASQHSTTQDESTTTEQQLFEKQTIGHVTISYDHLQTRRSITTSPIAFYLIRAPNLPAQLLQVNHDLDCQRNRIETVDALRRAMAEDDYNTSRAILAIQVEKIKASASAQDPFCQALVQDLEHSFPSEQEYRSTQYTSYRYHGLERGGYMPNTTTSSERYHTRRQQALIERYKQSQ